MRISDWSSDVCSSDLVDHAIVLITISVSSFLQNHPMSSGRCKGDSHDRTPPGNPPASRRPDRPRQDRPAGDAGCDGQCRITCGPDLPGSIRSSGRSEAHTSELQSLIRISYAVFFLKTKQSPTRTN